MPEASLTSIKVANASNSKAFMLITQSGYSNNTDLCEQAKNLMLHIFL